jgi:hypothetical protein
LLSRDAVAVALARRGRDVGVDRGALRVGRGDLLHQRVLGREHHEGAPKSVSGRVVKT